MSDIERTFVMVKPDAVKRRLIGEIISGVAKGCGCKTVDHTILRQEVIKSLGPLRLKYMKDFLV